ncbi:DNA methylase [Erwinia psidii]|uniref:N-6 DNA methylase n=1 Tax=Erwinia psidii TaxID=69224 RepID=UPI00226B7257|nr:N-6 DNA methylase [Erwinia psidii]MCX8967406.1 DNA methylase [Erwinia psidii]
MHANSVRKSDSLGRYFTSETVGQLLIDSMQSVTPSLVLDLGAGDGALTAAASRQWANANFLTVDIDLNAGSKSLLHCQEGRFIHTTADALCHDLPDKINLALASADAAVCNPPYIRPKWQSDFRYILEEAGLDDVLCSKNDVSAELLFIAQNLRLLKNGGMLGLILPDGIISGDKHSELRRKLLENHAIQSVIELPRGVFSRTDAKTHILVLEKNGKPTSSLLLRRFDNVNQFSKSVRIDASDAIVRLDYSYHANIQKQSSGRKVGNVASRIARGRTSSSQRHTRPYPVFHTSDMFSGCHMVPANFLLKSSQTPLDEIVANPGDILISRVGRNLTEKMCIVENGHVVISDCIMLIRVPDRYRNLLFSYLSSPEGRVYLDAVSHGVGAKFLTQKAILELTF